MALIHKLCEAYGPSGREDNIRKIIETELAQSALEISVDQLGNLICRKPSSKNTGSDKIMFCAHMDEIGLIITHIDKNGFLRFTNVGGVFPEHALYQEIMFENGVHGIIAVETKPETPRPLRLDNMYIDIGAKDKDDAQHQVKIGDIVSFYRPASGLDKKFTGKALDDRIGCYCLIETIKRIRNNKDDLYFVFSVQEEVGLRGAQTGAYRIGPKYAIAVDVTRSGDTPESLKMEMSLGKGTAVKVKDSRFIANPIVKDRLINIAQRQSIPYQLEILEQGTTDAAVIQLIKEGVQSGVVSVPTRYIHSTCETCDLDDVEHTIKLLTYVGEYGLE